MFHAPDDAIIALSEKLKLVEVENSADRTHDYTSLIHRVLAQDALADRDSPAADVSAMDGYAIRISDRGRTDRIEVSAQCVPGKPPMSMTDHSVVRVFTGAIVPDGCQAVVKREDTEEFENEIRLLESVQSIQEGENIRRSGENALAGSVVLRKGTLLTAASLATLANFGVNAPAVYHPVRVAVLTTGDEVGEFSESAPEPWELRNSNRASILGLIQPFPWIDIVKVVHQNDDREALEKQLASLLKEVDAVLMTGGVSKGDYDYVPDVIRSCGGEVVFHGLPIRPGKPILGAATSNGKLILGLPGNPVSATIGCHHFGLPLLAKQSGQVNWIQRPAMVQLDQPGSRTLPLHWLRLVKMKGSGEAIPVQSRGSGDLVSLGESDGYVAIPPGEQGEGPWKFFEW